MNRIRQIVVAVLLAVWCFPAVSLASPVNSPAPVSQSGRTNGTAVGSVAGNASSGSEAQRYAARERQVQNLGLEQFQGGDGVSVYIGSGVIGLVIIVLLLVILL